MDIFESLENLNVSEECFNDIVGLVEELLSEDIVDSVLKHTEGDDSKRAKLLNKVLDNKTKEVAGAEKREGRSEKEMSLKRNVTKNDLGEFRNFKRALKKEAPYLRSNNPSTNDHVVFPSKNGPRLVSPENFREFIKKK